MGRYEGGTKNSATINREKWYQVEKVDPKTELILIEENGPRKERKRRRRERER